jgi:D-galactonate transporter
VSDPAAARRESAYAKVTLRLVPFLFLGYVVAYLDRVNVGFAKLQMQDRLGFSDTVYGLGAGVFFISYVLFEVPSNLILHRVGARIWIARIAITWGLVSAAMILVGTPASFYALRFLLGAAEAGFFPGIMLYLTYWYPDNRRGKIVSMFLMGIPISSVIGGPLSGWILLRLSGWCGLAGWQWLFLVEGLPSIAIGAATLLFLPDGIRRSHWLDEDEKALLEEAVAAEGARKEEGGPWRAFSHGRVWLACATYFCFVMALYAINFWLPSIIHAMGVADPLDVGLLTALPWATAAVAMVLAGHSADNSGERRWHIAVPAFLGGTGLVLSVVYGGSTTAAMASLCLATLGIMTTIPLFWSLPTAFLGGVSAAAGLALINSMGNIAGFVSPFFVGWMKDTTHSTDKAMYVLAGFMFLGGLLTLGFPAKVVNSAPRGRNV